MKALSRLEKLEETAARDLPCAWHALAEMIPRPRYVAPADNFPGTCPECDGDMDFNMGGCAPRERELSAEFYARGYTLSTFTASRRACAAMLWLSRRGQKITAAPGEVYKQSLIDEHNRRMGKKWMAHFDAISDEELEAIRDLIERDLEGTGPADAELEAIIWPGGRG